jgi:exonuclease SbcD
MRILHTSDWHLGRVLHQYPLLEDQRAILDQIIAHCRETPYDALLISGDLFDRSLPPEDAVRLWSHFLRDLRAVCPALPILVIAGNHDSAARVAYAADALTFAQIHVRGGSEAILSPVPLVSAAGERMQIWMIPFLWAGDLDVLGEDGERLIRTQEETLKEAIDRIRPLQDPGALQVVLAHCFARGGSATDSERTLVGTATDVDPGLLEPFDYSALGHLHRCQKINDRAWYSGSPLPYSFSEAQDDKGMLSVELTRDQPPAITRVPLRAPHPMRRLRGPLQDLLQDPRHAPDTECLVEITLRKEDAGANPFALLKTRFPFLLHLDYEPDPADAAALALGRTTAERPGDLLSDFRQFAASIGLDAETAETRAALAEGFIRELAAQEPK